MAHKISIAAVTGGGNGIGAELCRRLAQDDVKVVVVDLPKDTTEAVAAEINGVA